MRERLSVLAMATPVPLFTVGYTPSTLQSLAFAAFCHKLNIPAAMCAVTLLNRLRGDQVCCVRARARVCVHARASESARVPCAVLFARLP